MFRFENSPAPQTQTATRKDEARQPVRSATPVARSAAPPFAPARSSAFVPHQAQTPFTTAVSEPAPHSGGLKFGATSRPSCDGYVLLDRLAVDAPCIRWGVQSGDTLLELNGCRMDDIWKFDRAIVEMPRGTPIKMTIKRKGELIFLVGILGE